MGICPLGEGPTGTFCAIGSWCGVGVDKNDPEDGPCSAEDGIKSGAEGSGGCGDGPPTVAVPARADTTDTRAGPEVALPVRAPGDSKVPDDVLVWDSRAPWF